MKTEGSECNVKKEKGSKEPSSNDSIVRELIAPYLKPCVSQVCHAMFPYLLGYTLFLVLSIVVPLYLILK